MADPQPRRGFQTPPEVLRYFGDKTLRPAFSWQDVWGEEHAYAFTVAKATEVELLTAFKRSIAGALASGQGFETWREGLLPELQRLGWLGPRRVSDPTGQQPDRVVNFGSPRRLQTIFWSNMNSARSAGQWERAQRTKAALPFILYVRTSSRDPRAEHLGWVGIILPIDHPWWQTHWPPNGWGCKCSIRQITAREAEALLGRPPGNGGIVYRAAAPDDGPPRTWRNSRTGEISEVPTGIDPGWQTNPGLSRARTLVTRLDEVLATAGADDAKAAIVDLWSTPAARILMGLPEQLRMPVAIAPAAQEALQARSGLVVVSNEMMRVKSAPTRARPMQLDRLAEAQVFIDQGQLVDRGQPNRRSVLTEREDGWWQTVLARSAAGFLRLVSLHRVRTRRARKWLDDDAAGRP